MNCISLKEQKGKTKMKRGFTLIELMIVISVMAILIGISLPYFKGMQDEGNSAKCAGELRTLTTGIESYYIHNSNEYPSQRTTSTEPATAWQSALTGATPTIVKVILDDPFDPGEEYNYVTSATPTGSEYYVVFSVGPDGAKNISTITDAGVIAAPGDDIYITNAESGVGGF